MLKIETLPALQDNYIFFLHDTETLETVVIDPSEASSVLSFLEEKNWKLSAIWNTHHHPDHTGGNEEIKAKTSCQIFGPKEGLRKIPGIDKELSESDQLNFSSRTVRIIETPGHTKEAVCFFLEEDKVLFCGDSLFSLGCGRLFEGTAKDLWSSLQKIKTLPPETLVYCAHEYSLGNSHFARSLEPENKTLEAYQKELEGKRAENKPTIPSLLSLELEANPFLRTDVPSLQETVGCSQQEEWLVFKKVRELKDSF